MTSACAIPKPPAAEHTQALAQCLIPVAGHMRERGLASARFVLPSGDVVECRIILTETEAEETEKGK